MSINTNQLSDEEKYFLLKLSYIDLPPLPQYFDSKKTIEEVLDGAMIIRGIEEQKVEEIKELKAEFIELSKKNQSLKEIKIIDYENHNVKGNSTDPTKTGFVAYALEDENGNRGFLFRGSETESFVDWSDNAASGLNGTSEQVKQANDFFDKYSQDKDKTYSLYGHSKGNNLAAEVYLNNLDKDISAYGVNGQPVHWFDLTEEQKAALRSDRYTFIVHEGDVVSALGYVDYVDVVVNLKNPEKILTNPLHPHSLTSVEFDKEGKFVSTQEPNTLGRQFINGVATGVNMFKRIAYDRYVNFLNDPLGIGILRDIGKDLYYYTIDTVTVIWKYVSEKAFEFADFVKNRCIETISRLVNWTNEKLDQLKTWFISAMDEVKGFFSSMADFFGGGTARVQHLMSDIRVNTADLRNVAYRLQMIQNKISHVDRRLDTLASLVDIEETFSVMWVDMKVGYDYELKRCMDYLNNTADKLEQCERGLMQKAYGFR